MKKMLFVAVIPLLGLFSLLTSCATQFDTVTASLYNVEAPKDAKTRYGETKIVPIQIDGKTNYQYEDDYIDIKWSVGQKEFYFTLKNKSDYTIRLPWEDVSYVNILGSTGRVMHNGIKYSEKNNSQPPSVIPKNSSLTDVILPTDNVHYINVGTSSSWVTIPLINLSIDKNNFEESKKQWIGKTVRVLLPIVIEGVKNDYIFEFRVEDIQKGGSPVL